MSEDDYLLQEIAQSGQKASTRALPHKWENHPPGTEESAEIINNKDAEGMKKYRPKSEKRLNR